MDPTVLAAIIGGVFTIAAGVIVWYLQRPKQTSPAIATTAPLNESGDAPRAYARRYLDYPSHYRFVKSLPKLRAVVVENAQEGWDTGVTSDMRQASYDVIDFLEYAWIRLSQFYPDKHWKDQSAEDYIRGYIQERFYFHWSKHEPEGPGTGGTIVGVLTGGDVIDDLENLISDTVATLFVGIEDFDFRDWKQAWSGKASNV